MSYKVEELLALRDSVSESAVSIDKFPDEDVIKEHVLRPTVSANVVGAAPFDKPLRASATPGVAPATTDLKKPSPSPSVKRGKAERLLKEHGSPPGMRVTAGGRVVPSDLPPLGGVRFGNGVFKPQGLRSVDPGNAMAGQTHLDVNNTLTPQVQLVGTQAVIRVGDRMYTLPAYDPSYPMPSAAPPGLDTIKQPGGSARMPTQGAMPSIPLVSQVNRTQSPFVGLDLPTLESQWASKKEELRYVEQTEVLQADQQGPAWRTGIIAKKKSLILEIDTLRKQISAAKEAENSKGGPVPNQSTGLAGQTVPAAATAPAFVPPFQQPVTQGLYPNLGMPITVPTPSPFQPLMMYPGYAPAGTQFPAEVPQFTRDSQFFLPGTGESVTNGDQFPKAFTQGVNAPHSPGSAGRRSHAVPIKKPQEDTKKQVAHTSRLDPKSPTYEPVTKPFGNLESAQDHNPPTPSPAKPSPWRPNETGSAQSHKHEGRAISQKPSMSSIDTTDFFPTNTHEHSSTRVAPNKLSGQPSSDNTVPPATPDKTWPTSPWNPSSGGQSNPVGLTVHNDPPRRLTSWGEAFGKQSSFQSNSTKTLAESATTLSALRKSSEEQPSADLNWPPIASKPVSHAPSTYQEGYQAGIHHLGLPDNSEVLNGFLDGLAAILKDRSLRDRKDRNYPLALYSGHMERDTSSARSSLRGYLPAVAPHDSAVCFAENMRSGKTNPLSSAFHRQSIYSPKEPDMEAPITYTFCNELSREQYAQVRSATMNQEQHVRKSPANNSQSNDDQARGEFAQSTLLFPRQFSGNQLGNRMYGTPVSMQRYFPTPKEYTQGFPSADVQHSARSVPHQRFSGMDGAMDDLAGLMLDTNLDEKAPDRSGEAEASCFKSSGKGKQAASSPTKSNTGNGKDVSSPGKDTTSPKKSGGLSPAKDKLEQVISNRLRRQKKDDPTTMSPEDKQRRTEKWRGRFRQIKAKETAEIMEYAHNNPGKGEGARRG